MTDDRENGRRSSVIGQKSNNNNKVASRQYADS